MPGWLIWLIAAGVLGTKRRGLWAYYFVIPESLRELGAWLS